MPAVPKTDTSPAAAAAQAGVLRSLSPGRRLDLAVDMSLSARALLGARLRSEHPDWSEAEVNLQLLWLTGAVLPPRLNDGG